MTADKKPGPRDPIDTVLRALEKKDAVAAASAYAEDAVFVDPRYPESEYRGRETIREAFEWALTNSRNRPEYTTRNHLEAQQTSIIEVDARHTGTDRSDGEFPRVFVAGGRPSGTTGWAATLGSPSDRG
jgi:ketosteroid isomerase-like protein